MQRAAGGGITLLDRRLTAVAAVLALGFCLPALRGLADSWRGNEFYGHAYLIPATAAFLAFAERARVRRALQRGAGPPLGAWIILAAALFQALAWLGDLRFLAGLGIPLVLAAIAYGWGGRRLLRPLALPILFLAAMVPPPDFVTETLLLRLRLLVTESSVALLQAWGSPVHAEGNVVHLPGATLFVADACSGLTSIVTLFPFALVIAYFLSRGIWRRAVVITSVVPLALGANIVRVMLTVSMVSTWGVEAAQGALHSSFGVATYAVGNLALIGVARLLR